MQHPSRPYSLPGFPELAQNPGAKKSAMPPAVRRAVLRAVRANPPAFYLSAMRMAGGAGGLEETLTGDWTAPCPLPFHGDVRRAGAGFHGCALERRRPLRIHHGDSGAGWRCASCGSGGPVEFLRLLFGLPEHQSDAAGWNLAARLAGVEPGAVDPRSWMLWDVDRAHAEWGAALVFTRTNLELLRSVFRNLFPAWSDSEILSFPATGRGTWLSAYRVRGRLTQLEETAFPGTSEAPEIAGRIEERAGPLRPSERVVRFHHGSARRESPLPRSVTGVWPDTLGRPSSRLSAPSTGEARTNAAHVFQGAENAASARRILGVPVIGVPSGPLGLGHADMDALASVSCVHVWAANDPRGRGFQYFVVRLLRACGIRADAVRWDIRGNFPRGWDLNRLIREGGVVALDDRGNPHPQLPESSRSRTAA